MKRTVVMLMVAVLALSMQVYGSEAGTTKGEFLKFGTGARSAGLGEAFTAVSDNAHAVHWNPAGLVQLDNKQMQCMYLHYLTDIMVGNVAYAQKLTDKTGVGVEFLNLYTIEIMRDEYANEIGEFSNYNGSLTVGLGTKITGNLSLGLSVKSIYLRYMNQAETGNGMDVGGLYITSIKEVPVQVGLTVKDIGEGIPTRGVVGISGQLMGNMLVSCDVCVDGGSTETNIGMEYATSGKLVLRGGYTRLGSWEGIEGIKGICGGVGLDLGNKGLDYAFMPYGELGVAHRISFSMKF
jgi:hypothetical protein